MSEKTQVLIYGCIGTTRADIKIKDMFTLSLLGNFFGFV